MNPADLMQRLQDFMLRIAMPPQNFDASSLADEMDALLAEIEQAAALADDPRELIEAAQGMSLLADTLRDPELLANMVQTKMEDLPPNPPIFDLIEDEDIAGVTELLKSVDVNARYGTYDSTALYHAMSAMDGVSVEMVNLLLDAGADPNLGLTHTNVLHGLGFSNPRGVSADELAQVVLRCVALGADIEQRSEHLKWTPLLGAASEWNEVAVEALLLAGADITARAGDVQGVCFAGQDAFAMADGHPQTYAVLERFKRPN